ncbi:ATP-binding cassette domain-containing protein [Propionivibrio sp.]|uniref:ATP-binding cassette domain-containing protein n=1 Tax=Propionivibrio sp. TaxID=2212460 RepID=UPI003BF17092
MLVNDTEIASLQAVQATDSGLGLSISKLVKCFGEREVLHGLDLDIRPGEFVSVVGRSGCGKSTLLRLLAGLEEITDGRIAFDGDEKEHNRNDVRFMFQDARLLPWRTVIQNVALGLPGNKDEVRALAQEVLEQVGLADRADDWPGRFSGGQRQRVALARALIHRPRLLLLDEPLGALDALTRIEMQRLIVSLWQQHGFTAVLVTHDVSDAVAVADRILLVEEGRITLDEQVSLARPREHGQPEFAALENRVLKRLMTVNAINVRNQIPGRIVGITIDRPLSEVRIETASGIVTATVSTRSLSEQPLELGAEVLALFKSTEVVLATEAA